MVPFAVFVIVAFEAVPRIAGNRAIAAAVAERDLIIETLPQPSELNDHRASLPDPLIEVDFCFQNCSSPRPFDGRATATFSTNQFDNDETFALLENRLEELGYEPRCNNLRPERNLFDAGPGSHTINLFKSEESDVVTLLVFTSLYGAREVGSPDLHLNFSGCVLGD